MSEQVGAIDMGVNWNPAAEAGSQSIQDGDSFTPDGEKIVHTPGHYVITSVSLDWNLERYEKGHILSCLYSRKGNRTRAAKALGISVRTLQRKLKKWNQQ